MEIDKNSLKTEPLPESAKQDYIRFLLNVIKIFFLFSNLFFSVSVF